MRSIEQACVPRSNIVVAGFSQGACLATEFVASSAIGYGGLIAFTGGLIGPPGSIKARDIGLQLEGMPAFLGSGDPDPHVPWARVEESAVVLRAMGAKVATKRYPGRPHTITQDEITHAASLLQAVRAGTGERFKS